MGRKNRFDVVTTGLIIIYFACITIPWLYYRVGSKFGLLFLLLWMAVTYSVKRRRNNLSESLFYIFFLLYAGLEIVYPMFGHGTYPTFSFIARYGNSIACYYILMYFLKTRKYDNLKVLLLCIVAFYALSALMNCIHLGLNAELSRDLTSGTDSISARIKGVARMDFVIAMAIFAPAIFYVGIKAQKRMKILLIITSLLMAMAVFRASYTIITLSCVVGFAIAISSFLAKARKPLICVIVVSLSLFLVYPSSYAPMARVLESLVEYLSDSPQYSNRLKEVVRTIETGEIGTLGDMAARWDLYNYSWEAFCNRPIVGNGTWYYQTGKSMHGGHSEVLDNMADMGLVWVFVTIGLFWSYYRSIHHRQSRYVAIERRNVYAICMWPAFFVSVLDPCDSPMVWGMLFLLVPILPMLIPRVDKELNMNPNIGRSFYQAQPETPQIRYWR